MDAGAVPHLLGPAAASTRVVVWCGGPLELLELRASRSIVVLLKAELTHMQPATLLTPRALFSRVVVPETDSPAFRSLLMEVAGELLHQCHPIC